MSSLDSLLFFPFGFVAFSSFSYVAIINVLRMISSFVFSARYFIFGVDCI